MPLVRGLVRSFEDRRRPADRSRRVTSRSVAGRRAPTERLPYGRVIGTSCFAEWVAGVALKRGSGLGVPQGYARTLERLPDEAGAVHHGLLAVRRKRTRRQRARLERSTRPSGRVAPPRAAGCWWSTALARSGSAGGSGSPRAASMGSAAPRSTRSASAAAVDPAPEPQRAGSPCTDGAGARTAPGRSPARRCGRGTSPPPDRRSAPPPRDRAR